MDANKYIGIPFLDRGRFVERGLDCWGLVMLVYRCEYEIELPSYTTTYTSASSATTNDVFSAEKDAWTKVEEPEPGDVLVFYSSGGVHVGILVSPGLVLNVRRGADACIDRLAILGKIMRHVGTYRHNSRLS